MREFTRPAQAFFHPLIDRLLIAARFHIDEVQNDQPTHVPQPQLAADFIGRFQVDADDSRFLIFGAFMTSGVHVDGHQGFGFIDDDVTAAFEMDDAAERPQQRPTSRRHWCRRRSYAQRTDRP